VTEELVHVLEVTRDEDLVAVRHSAVTVCAALGLEERDGLRLVTSVDALAQDLVRTGGGRIGLTCGVRGPLTVRFSPVAVTGRQSEPGSWASSAPAVALLVDGASLGADGDPAAVTLTTGRLRSEVSASDLARLASELTRGRRGGAGDVLHDQTRDLLRVLAQAPASGVPDGPGTPPGEDPDAAIALYHELSEELERTNQGVVALYAELDEKSRQLREASEAKTRFLRSISHELRSPANSIIGLTRLLLDSSAAAPLNEEQNEQVTFIASSARDLLDLVNELLDLAAAESGRLDAALEPVALADLVEDLRGTTRPLLRPGVQLEVEQPPEGAVIHTDPALLRHVLRNLLSNAAKFTAEGRVGLRLEERGDRVRIEVSDTGIGIAPADQERIFEEFFQVRSPLHAGVKGTGLGLAFAQRVAVTLGGSVEVTSSPGVGSRFTVELPRDPAREPVQKGHHP
jgi:signal transduction histidine kinase